MRKEVATEIGKEIWIYFEKHETRNAHNTHALFAAPKKLTDWAMKHPLRLFIIIILTIIPSMSLRPQSV